MPAFIARTLQDEETRPHSHPEDFIFRRQKLQVLTQMLKITYGNRSVTVRATVRWGLLDVVIDHPKQVLTKMAPLIRHVFISNLQSGFDPKREKCQPEARPPTVQRNWT